MNPDSSDPIAIALAEDIGTGDVTTQFFVPPKLKGHGRIVARERCVVAGIETAAEVFRRIDSGLRIEILQRDGALVMETKRFSKFAGTLHPFSLRNELR